MIQETAVIITTKLKLCADVEAMIYDPMRSVMIVEVDGIFAGFALIDPFRNGPGYAHTAEHSVYRAANVKRKGIGRLLLDELLRVAIEMGHHVMVCAISGGNLGSLKFHHKSGFKQVGHMPQVG